MAHPSDHRLCDPWVVRLVLVLVGVFMMVCIMGPSFLRHSNDHHLSSPPQSSCPSCLCDCSETVLPISLDFWNSSFTDCGKHDPEMNEELEKDISSLLSEELILLKNVTDSSLEHTKGMIMDAKRTSSHYQKEAEKCNAGMETCEQAREKAEAALIEERKLSALWEERAREHGWKDERRVYSSL